MLARVYLTDQKGAKKRRSLLEVIYNLIHLKSKKQMQWPQNVRKGKIVFNNIKSHIFLCSNSTCIYCILLYYLLLFTLLLWFKLLSVQQNVVYFILYYVYTVVEMHKNTEKDLFKYTKNQRR